jgi:nucleoside-diphosphate-sugar epimerase
MKNLLIIGGTGFIGYHLSKAAIKKGWKVTSLSRKKPKKKRTVAKVKYIFCNISKKNNLKKKIKKNFLFVVNLGGNIDHSSKKEVYKNHLEGFKNLCDILLSRNIKTFVQIGTSVEYGKQSSPHSENKDKIPSASAYAEAKYLATKYAQNLFIKKKFPIVVLRLYQAYGPNQKTDRLIPSLINSCLKNEYFPCTEGRQLRDFIYIDDVISSIFKCYGNKRAVGQIINIGSGKPKKIRSVINLIKRMIGKGKPDFGKIKLRIDESLKLYPNISKAKKILDWKPRINFNKGILKTIMSYKHKNYRK